MKILLISSNIASTPYSVYPLGMGMVAQALVQAGHQVTQFDFLQNEMSITKVCEVVADNMPHVVGISIRNIDNVNLVNEQKYLDAVKNIVAAVKKTSQAPVVLGGSGFSIMPEAIMEAVGADFGIVGEGEYEFVKFVNEAASGRFPEKKCIVNQRTLAGSQIQSALYDPDILAYYLQNGNIASIQTKRGCPNQCAYCTYPSLEGKQIRGRDPEKIIADIHHLIEAHQTKYIFFVDSVFNDDGGHFRQVVKKMHDHRLNVSWTAYFKPTNLSDDDIIMMKETGLKGAEIGADAATDITLKKMGKSFNFNDIVNCNAQFNRHNIATAHFYMMGGPGETQETVLEGIENIKSLKNTVSFIFMGIRILPHTPLAKIAIEKGLIAENTPLLDSKYYIEPGLDRDWLQQTMEQGFSGLKNCIFPPDKLDSSLAFLHKLGYTGSLWDMLIPKKPRQRKKVSGS